jgi:hypothetical protein
MTRLTRFLIGGLWLIVSTTQALIAAAGLDPVSFSQSAQSVEAYDFVEVTLNVMAPRPPDPFTDASVTGAFGKPGATQIAVTGFCDAEDGSVYRIRFAPSAPGNYTYSVTYRDRRFSTSHEGTFRVVDGHRRGVLRVDPKYPLHFIWEGTGEHYFWNGTTAFFMMAWTDNGVIQGIIDRLHSLKVNRIRALLTGRWATSAGEPIVPEPGYAPYLNPWVAERPESFDNPGLDYTRFNVAYYQKWERMLSYARSKDMIISVIMDWNDSKVHPAALSEDEKRYYAYTAARLGAFSNITWDLGDDISSFRSLQWSHDMGTALVENWDSHHHLASDHPVDNAQQDRASSWFGFTSFQEWHRPIHGWMLEQRKAQLATGRIIPQTNEEYGYEDHYPRWSPNYPGGQSPDADRRAAWEIAMAGGYQTTGETAKLGTGVWPDTGGGWVNGRGDDTMVMLKGYAHVVDFFTGLEWWKMNPNDGLATEGDFCLADPGKTYVAYIPRGGAVDLKLEPGNYRASWFNPRTGETIQLPPAHGPVWSSPKTPDNDDWVALLEAADRESAGQWNHNHTDKSAPACYSATSNRFTPELIRGPWSRSECKEIAHSI